MSLLVLVTDLLICSGTETVVFEETAEIFLGELVWEVRVGTLQTYHNFADDVRIGCQSKTDHIRCKVLHHDIAEQFFVPNFEDLLSNLYFFH